MDQTFYNSHVFSSEQELQRGQTRELESRWESLQKERTTAIGSGFPLVQDPRIMSQSCMTSLRIRKEPNGRDYMNARLWDSFRATPATEVSADMLQTKEGPKYMDMNPIPSRNDKKNFRYQPTYMPSNEIPTEKKSLNPYLQPLNVEDGNDGRNLIRELRTAVEEDNREREVETGRRITERMFSDRWLPPQAAEDFQAYELLRPKLNFYS
jgi:hypothetical protein